MRCSHSPPGCCPLRNCKIQSRSDQPATVYVGVGKECLRQHDAIQSKSKYDNVPSLMGIYLVVFHSIVIVFIYVADCQRSVGSWFTLTRKNTFFQKVLGCWKHCQFLGISHPQERLTPIQSCPRDHIGLSWTVSIEYFKLNNDNFMMVSYLTRLYLINKNFANSSQSFRYSGIEMIGWICIVSKAISQW